MNIEHQKQHCRLDRNPQEGGGHGDNVDRKEQEPPQQQSKNHRRQLSHRFDTAPQIDSPTNDGDFNDISSVCTTERGNHRNENNQGEEDEHGNSNLQHFLKELKRMSSSPSSSPFGGCHQPRLYGREEEKAELVASWKRCCQKQQREFVVVAGAPGTGKSELAYSLRSAVARNWGDCRGGTTAMGDCDGGGGNATAAVPRRGLFISGKFPEFPYHAKVPFEVFVQATTSLVHQIVDGGDETLRVQCRKKLCNFVPKEDQDVLFKMIPDLKLLFSPFNRDYDQEIKNNNTKMWRRGGGGANNDNKDKHNKKGTLGSRIQKRHGKNHGNQKEPNTIGQTTFLQHQEVSTRLYGCETENRLKAAYAATLGAICSVTPVLFLLDDLGWADKASLAMLQSLFRYPQNVFPLLIVATYRTEDYCATKTSFPQQPMFLTNEEKETGHFQNILMKASTDSSNSQEYPLLYKTLESLRSTGNTKVSTIVLGNIRQNDLVELVSDVLQLHNQPTEESAELARVVYEQTQGNVFHVFQLMRFLAETNLISKVRREDDHLGDTSFSGWWWDLKQLEQELTSGSSASAYKNMVLREPKYSVFDLVLCTLNSLPEEILYTLKVASCMGVDVDVSALDIVAGNSKASGHCKYAAEVGLLVFSPQYGGYRFVHDHIRHAANRLIPEDESQSFYLMIGKHLWKRSTPSALENNIMMVVSLLNVGSSIVVEQSERYQLAALNLQAALKAYSLPSFSDAGVFLLKGIEFLDEDCWKTHYQLSLELYSYAAEVETLNANYKVGLSFIHKVLRHGECLDDKLKAYAALPRSLELQGDWKGAIGIAAQVVRELGQKVPKKPSRIAIVKELWTCQRLLKGKSILDLPELDGTGNKIRILQFLTVGMVIALRYKDPMSIMFASRAVSLTLKFGQHGFSSIALAVLGVMLCGFDLDKNEGFRLGQIAISLAERQETMMYKSWVDFFVGSGIAHWTRPLELSMDILESSNTLATEMGYVHQAILARLITNWTALAAGRPLPATETDLKDLLSLARFYNHKYPANPVSLTLTTTRLYEGFASSTNESSISQIREGIQHLCSSALSFLNFSNDRAVCVVHLSFATDLALFYGDTEEAAKMTKIFLNASKEGPSSLFQAGAFSFTIALIGMSLLRQNSVLAKGFPTRKHMDLIWRRASDCPYNYLPFKLLLDAEWASLHGPNTRKNPTRQNVPVESLYEKAFLAAQEQSNRRIMALSCELYGNHLSEEGDSRGSQSMWEKSAEIYKEWGALVKSRLLKSRAASSAYFSARN